MIPERLIGLLGIAVMLAITVLLSYDRKNINWRLVGIGLALQFGVGLLMLKTGAGRAAFSGIGAMFDALLRFQAQGARFVFGNLVQPALPVGIPGPGGALDTTAGYVASVGAMFAFSVVPTIIFFSALMSVLYHLGVMQLVVRGIAWAMQRTLRASGAETVAAAANIFLGPAPVPLLIKPFVARLTASEVVSVMVVGFATSASAVMAVYIALLQPYLPGIAGDLIAASVLNTVTGLLLGKILMPETGTPLTMGSVDIPVEKSDTGVIDAAANGARQGVQLAIGIVATVLAFVALLALCDAVIGWVGGLVGQPDASLKVILGELLRPLVWVMGVPWGETAYVGGLIALKLSILDLVAYGQLATDLGGGMQLDPRSVVVCTYALLGFANFATIGVQIAAIGGLAPERRSEVARYGMRTLIVGNLAAFMSACLAGMLV